ncbi:MAG: helix-turn-helix domain-containing protein [Leptospirales bacterium]
MRYRQFPPPPALTEFVRHFWTLSESTGSSSTRRSREFRIIADGSPGLIFQDPAQGGLCFDAVKELPPAFVYGQATRHAELRLKGGFRTIGVSFAPHGLKALFGNDAHEITDSCIDISEADPAGGPQLVTDLTHSGAPPGFPSPDEGSPRRLELLVRYLGALTERRRSGGSISATATARQAVDMILKTHGNITPAGLLAVLRISERSLERIFKQHVGLTPRMFARICRFQSALHRLKSSDCEHGRLTEIAFDADYADQSHFIRSFREFAGFSPREFQRESRAVTENLQWLP